MTYNEEALSVLDGYGITKERRDELIENYIHGSRAEVLGRISNSEDLPPNEQHMLLIEVGVRLVCSTVEEMTNALEKK